MKLLQLKEVIKEFHNRIILDRISFSIEEGDIFGIIGPSGSGKTTLLNLLVGFYEPDEGKILYQLDPNHKPKNLHQHLSTIKKKIGFATQVPSFYPRLTVQENMEHFGRLYGLKKSVLKKNIENLLEFTELKNHQHKLAEYLSVGMQKRLDLSCSLIHYPQILLLDEPTANLDPLLRKEILYLIKQANKQGITIIIASHQLNDIEKICNKVALLHQGKLHLCGSLEQIKQPYIHQEGSIYLKVKEDHERLIKLIRQLPVTKIIDRRDSLIIFSPELQNTLYHLFNLIQEENLALQDIEIRKPSLPEIFEKIVEEKTPYF